MEYFKLFVAAILISFSIFTAWVIWKESFFKSLKKILAFRWGVQIFTDLAIGIVLFNFIIYLNEGSIWVALAWFGASVLLGNLATMTYFHHNYQTLLAHFS